MGRRQVPQQRGARSTGCWTAHSHTKPHWRRRSKSVARQRSCCVNTRTQILGCHSLPTQPHCRCKACQLGHWHRSGHHPQSTCHRRRQVGVARKDQALPRRQENLPPSEWSGPGPTATKDQVVEHIIASSDNNKRASLRELLRFSARISLRRPQTAPRHRISIVISLQVSLRHPPFTHLVRLPAPTPMLHPPSSVQLGRWNQSTASTLPRR